jgi:hypothetical protein
MFPCIASHSVAYIQSSSDRFTFAHTPAAMEVASFALERGAYKGAIDTRVEKNVHAFEFDF